MAQLLSYTLANGRKANNYPYHAEVVTQKEIEQHRNDIKRKVNVGGHNYEVFFSIRKDQGSFLHP